mmetsp:Transcript_6373/g.7969  ORF Transcript_6373/g.7969 Transcript_6373/m.7969 type:complete len:90 (+) Transcript_6373:484-753(+)
MGLLLSLPVEGLLMELVFQLPFLFQRMLINASSTPIPNAMNTTAFTISEYEMPHAITNPNAATIESPTPITAAMPREACSYFQRKTEQQ